MNLLKNNNHLLKFNGTWTANSLRIEKYQSGLGQDKTGTLELTNIPTWLFDSGSIGVAIVAQIPLDRYGFREQTKTINLTAITGTTVVVTVTYSYNGNQNLIGMTASFTATPATIQYETLIGFDQP